jgi:predicted nucleic acid-binding Zn ribbon protein
MEHVNKKCKEKCKEQRNKKLSRKREKIKMILGLGY